jgi:hypothetical protein
MPGTPADCQNQRLSVVSPFFACSLSAWEAGLESALALQAIILVGKERSTSFLLTTAHSLLGKYDGGCEAIFRKVHNSRLSDCCIVSPLRPGARQSYVMALARIRAGNRPESRWRTMRGFDQGRTPEPRLNGEPVIADLESFSRRRVIAG